MNEDEFYMAIAIGLAEHAIEKGERGFGALVYDGSKVIGVGAGTGSDIDPTCHSEIVAIREACAIRGGLLHGCTIYSTHEPCLMCIGAINHSKLSRVVFGSHRSNLPALFRTRRHSCQWYLSDTSHPPHLVAGVLEQQCNDLFATELVELADATEPQ